MVLITISWIYILLTTINLGLGLDKVMKINNKNFVVTSIFGLFTTTVIASIWAIFGRINVEFHIVLLLLNIFVLLKFHKSIIDHYKSFLLELQQLRKSLQIILAVVTVLIILQCSSIPFVIDNESYYIQTIKWLNEYGFVKGLANLHLFYGQTSGWHIAQSVFNFSFLYKNFNDLSGFCLLLGNVFAIQKLNEYSKNGNKNYLLVGLFPLFNIFFFQFISAPSPDIPVYIFSFVFFFYFLENFKEITSETFDLLVILVLFLLYIKNTTLTFAVFPLALLALNFKSLAPKLLKPSLLSILIILLFFIKNLIICGSPIFPSKILTVIKTDYAIPNVIQTYYYDHLKYYGYFLTAEQYNSMSAWDLFIRWITLPKLNGLFNKISFFLIAAIPFFIHKYKDKKALWLIYIIMILQIFLLLITSPQYRFFIHFTLFFSIFCLTCFVQSKKILNVLLILSQIPIAIILFCPLNVGRFANHKSLMEIKTFSTKNVIYPYSNSKITTSFETIQLGNLKYNSPQNNDFLWASGNGDLPCVNKELIGSFEKYFHYIPQMRTNDLKDGFYAKKISPDE